MTITEEMIIERAKKDRREYMREYRAKNRERTNAYQREWNRKFKETTGISYSTALLMKKAEKELRAEMEG